MEPSFPFWRPARSYSGRQVGIHIAGIAAAAGDFLPGGGDLTQRVGVVGDIRQDDQHVHPLFKGQVFRCRQRHTGRRDTLDGRVVGQVDEQDRPVNGAGLLEAFDKEVRILQR